jgi:hypothetical protein
MSLTRAPGAQAPAVTATIALSPTRHSSPRGRLTHRTHDVHVLSQTVGFHPNVNTATITLAFADFERFLAAQGNRVQYLQFT